MSCRVLALSKKFTRKQLEHFSRGYTKLPGGCWEWRRSLNATGYGQLGVMILGKKSHLLAHRLSYVIHYGTAIDELCVCHRCDNPKCVNPEHLFLGDRNANLQDARRKGRLPQWSKSEHCKRGHIIEGVTSSGVRYCRECAQLYSKNRYAKLKANNLTDL